MSRKRVRPPQFAGSHGSTKSAAVARFLETAAEFDRQAADAQRPSQKKHCESMANAYRFLAEQQAIVDEQLGTAGAESVTTIAAE
jgi:hypothetical protein